MNNVTLTKVRVLIVDDHRIVRDGVVSLLASEPGFEVCGSCGRAREALSLAEKHHPDVVVLDYFLEEGLDGADLVREFVELTPSPRVLVLSLHREEDVGERALRSGAKGFLSKKEGAVQLVAGIRAVAAGEYFVSPRLQALLLDKFVTGESSASEKRLAGLSNREFQIFRLLGAGLGVGEIAQRLGLSAHTAATHREHLKNKLGLHTADQVAKTAAAWLGSTE